MTIIYSYLLRGFIVFAHGNHGRTMLAVDKSRTVAINKALERMPQ